MAWYDEIVSTTKGNAQKLANALRNPVDTATKFAKDAPVYKYRKELAQALRGDFGPIDTALTNWSKTITPQDAANLGLGFAGTIKTVGKAPFELAHITAQRNAALPVSEGGLGLPASNTAMDRAKAMGYTTPAYHGTRKDFQEFDLSKHGSSYDKGDFGMGVYVSSEPTLASQYAKNVEGSNVMPLLVKEGNRYDVNGMQGMNELINKLGGEDKWFDLTNNPKEYADSIKKLGYNSVRDFGYPQTAIYDTSSIRSINAAFDPLRRNESDILAGVAAAPVGLLATEKEKKKK